MGLRAFGSTESTNPITNGDFALLRDALTLKYGEPLEASAAEIRRLGWQKGFYYHGKKRQNAGARAGGCSARNHATGK